ncbi:hypothetical protein V8D89_008859 [Ganoderma adspersum]
MNIAHSLPFDIHGTIIDQCADSPKLLSVCALVCRDWRKPSQFHIFRVITIRTRQQVYDLRDVLNSNRQLSSLVRTLWLQPSHPDPPLPIPSLFDTAATTLLPLLVNLRTWRFSGDTDEGDPSGRLPFFTRLALRLFRSAHERAGRNVATLDLYRLTFTSYPELVHTAQTLPRLRHLRCSEIEFKNPVDPSFSMSTFGRLPLFDLDEPDKLNDGFEKPER